jgi:hypothetical protein
MVEASRATNLVEGGPTCRRSLTCWAWMDSQSLELHHLSIREQAHMSTPNTVYPSCHSVQATRVSIERLKKLATWLTEGVEVAARIMV